MGNNKWVNAADLRFVENKVFVADEVKGQIDWRLRRNVEIVPCDYQDSEKCASVVLDMKPEKSSLPKLTFSWNWLVFISVKTEEEKEALLNAGFDIATREDGASTYGLVVDRRHITWCNFRRYGWSATPDEAGEHGYAVASEIYANGPTLIGAKSERDVIRDAMVASWTLLLTKELPGYFNSHEVQMMIERLFDDAIANTSQHATTREATPDEGWSKFKRTIKE
jgi:hypothetical protein